MRGRTRHNSFWHMSHTHIHSPFTYILLTHSYILLTHCDWLRNSTVTIAPRHLSSSKNTLCPSWLFATYILIYISFSFFKLYGSLIQHSCSLLLGRFSKVIFLRMRYEGLTLLNDTYTVCYIIYSHSLASVLRNNEKLWPPPIDYIS